MLSRKSAGWYLLAGLFLFLLGARLCFIHYFSGPGIFEDDWPIEADLFRRYVEGHLSLGYLVSAYHGHRMLIPRLFFLALFCANGRQWDPLIFMVAQAPFYALGVTILVGLCGKQMHGWGKACLAVFAAVAGVMPFGWENALYGCNIHFQLFTLFGILSIWCCWRYDAFVWRWWIGVLLATANLLVMGAGVLPTIATAFFLILGTLIEPARRTLRNIAGIAILLAIAGIGIGMAVPQQIHAVSLVRYLRSFALILAWPDYSLWSRCFIMQAPLLLLAALLLVRRIPLSDGRWLPVIIGFSFWIQAAATVRQRFAHFQASRYADSWTLLAICIAASLCFLLEALGGRRRYYHFLSLVWIYSFLSGSIDNLLSDLPKALRKDQTDRLVLESHIRQYFCTGNKSYLPVEYSEYISAPSIRQILPPDLINPNPPLFPVKEEHPADEESTFTLCRQWDFGLPIYGSRDKTVADAPKSIDLRYAVPQGTREVTLLVAGNVNLRVNGCHVETPWHNQLWKPVSVKINPKATSFEISASGEALGQMAFTAPMISTRHPLGLWARDIAGEFSQHSYTRIIWFGFVLMAGASIVITDCYRRFEPTHSAEPAEQGAA